MPNVHTHTHTQEKKMPDTPQTQGQIKREREGGEKKYNVELKKCNAISHKKVSKNRRGKLAELQTRSRCVLLIELIELDRLIGS